MNSAEFTVQPFAAPRSHQPATWRQPGGNLAATWQAGEMWVSGSSED